MVATKTPPTGSIPAPHFLLTAQSRDRRQAGAWRFVLQTADGHRHLEVEDAEPAVGGDRLELLTVVRGLEALDRPACVTLITGSSYIKRGLSYGLDDWRANNWQWERHGEMVPVKNSDLWQRLDRALQIHKVECRLLRLDAAHDGSNREAFAVVAQTAVEPVAKAEPIATDAVGNVEDDRSAARHSDLESPTNFTESALRRTIIRRTDSRRLGPAVRRWLRIKRSNLRLWVSQLGTHWLPKPWFE